MPRAQLSWFVPPALLVLATIQPAPATASPAPGEDEAADQPGEGVLHAVGADGRDLGPCPLQHTDVRIEVSGDLARARVTQKFGNPFDHRIEAVYAFPLPEKAAVNAFEMRIGDRVIAGVLKQREEARQEYEAARDRGESASLLEQERPNLFTQSVANIPPGGTIEVQLTYVDALPYEQGAYHLAFPLTIGPRYNPPGVSDAAKVTPPYAVGTRAGHDVAISVAIDAGVPLREARSSSHQIQVTRRGPTTMQVVLAPGDTIPNRDFLLDLAVEPQQVASGLLAHTMRACDGQGGTGSKCDGYFKLLMIPTGRPPSADITPKELVFVMDTSGSMYGTPLDISKAAMRRALSNLNPKDTFAILRYSDDQSALSELPLANTPGNVKRAIAYLDTLDGEGGTNALGGVRAAFAYPHEEGRLRVVVFLTDGFIGNEDEIITAIQDRIGASRLFAVGIGSSVNRYLIDGMAAAGRGAELVVTPRDQADKVVDRLFGMVASPYLTDVEVDFGGLAVDAVTPSPIPDLFAGQPLSLWGRYTEPGRGTVTVRGRLAGKPFAQKLAVVLPDREPGNEAIATIWARREIERLTGVGESKGEEAVAEEITDLALQHDLMTKYTSFVAVEHREVAVPGGPPRRVPVASEMPEGVSPDRIFGDLSLQRFQPGDPELRVHAPASARAVTVVFPFGETKAAAWDPRVSAWTVRFLVPRSEAEGLHHIEVLVALADGSLERFRVPYAVDAGAAAFAVRALGPLVPGAEVVLEAVQVPTASDRALHPGRQPAGGLTAEIIADVTRLAVRTPDGTVLEMTEASPGTWQASWRVPQGLGTAAVEVTLTSVDMAGNTGIATVTVGVSPGAR